MANLLVIIILLSVVGLAIHYIWKEKKKGNKCIGCGLSGNCSGKCCDNEHKSN